MNYINVSLFVLAMLQMPACNSGQDSDVKALDEAVWQVDLMTGLPVEFVVESNLLMDSEQESLSMGPGVSSITRYEYISKNPIQETGKRAVFLKADIRHIQYQDVQKATAAMLDLESRAHPDMGLSYEWDYLILDRESIYHLHASCVFSENWFEQMVNALNKQFDSSDLAYSAQIFCRCGGGCRQFSNP